MSENDINKCEFREEDKGYGIFCHAFDTTKDGDIICAEDECLIMKLKSDFKTLEQNYDEIYDELQKCKKALKDIAIGSCIGCLRQSYCDRPLNYKSEYPCGEHRKNITQ